MNRRVKYLPIALFASVSLAFSGNTTGPVALRETNSLTARALTIIPGDTPLTLTSCTSEWCLTSFGGFSGHIHRTVLRLSEADESRVPPFAMTSIFTPVRTVFYANCTEVRAAGAAPLRRGQAGYRPDLDSDGDGVACE